jgi:uncharacterized protein YegL
MADQQPYTDPFQDQKFADNPEPRCPCILLLDTSYSMSGAPIDALNAGLHAFKADLSSDSLAAKRVEVAIVSFGGKVITQCEFITADQFQPPSLSASGDTPMGKAIVQAVDMVSREKDKYRAAGIAYYRPWIFLITDGVPTDDWSAASKKIKEGEDGKKFAFFCVGVGNANVDVLKQIAVRPPLMLDGLKFNELFMWLSSSQRSVSRSVPGDEVKLDDPTKKDGGWAAV